MSGALRNVDTMLRTANADEPATVMRVVGAVNRLLRVLETTSLSPDLHQPVRARVDDQMLSVRLLLDEVQRNKDQVGRKLQTLQTKRNHLAKPRPT
ncbi:MAG: hypothetical protein JNL94_17945 [Planctomycetes bacterium]|nr:hypothetical protein [Planctomycetota bacterium]